VPDHVERAPPQPVFHSWQHPASSFISSTTSGVGEFPQAANHGLQQYANGRLKTKICFRTLIFVYGKTFSQAEKTWVW
jgi:hypothetical protein